VSTLGLIYAIAAAVTWGVVYTIDQRILNNVTPGGLLLVDSVLALFFVLPILALQKKTIGTIIGLPPSLWIIIVASQGLSMLASFFIFSSIQRLGASTASIFEIMYPFFVAIFAYVLLGARPTVFFYLGTMIVFLGSAMIIGSR
jgi:chloramphenicol-sensitive protein RarD